MATERCSSPKMPYKMKKPLVGASSRLPVRAIHLQRTGLRSSSRRPAKMQAGFWLWAASHSVDDTLKMAQVPSSRISPLRAAVLAEGLYTACAYLHPEKCTLCLFSQAKKYGTAVADDSGSVPGQEKGAGRPLRSRRGKKSQLPGTTLPTHALRRIPFDGMKPTFKRGRQDAKSPCYLPLPSLNSNFGQSLPNHGLGWHTTAASGLPCAPHSLFLFTNIPATPRASVRKDDALRTRAGALFSAYATRVLTCATACVLISASSPNVCRTLLPRHVGPPPVTTGGLFYA
jgi:hypothetical protein